MGNNWNKSQQFSKVRPKKKGLYVLTKGTRSSLGGWVEMTAGLHKWNGHIWDIQEHELPISWRYSTPKDIKEMGDGCEKINKKHYESII